MHRLLFFSLALVCLAGWVQRTAGQRPGPGRIKRLGRLFRGGAGRQ